MIFKRHTLSDKGKRRREYYDYLKSSKWREFRQNALNFHGRKCKKCGSVERLEVHHKNYKNFGRELLEDVEVLCKTCHKGHHKKDIWKNGKKSKYMRDPNYDTSAVTFYPKRAS